MIILSYHRYHPIMITKLIMMMMYILFILQCFMFTSTTATYNHDFLTINPIVLGVRSAVSSSSSLFGMTSFTNNGHFRINNRGRNSRVRLYNDCHNLNSNNDNSLECENNNEKNVCFTTNDISSYKNNNPNEASTIIQALQSNTNTRGGASASSSTTKQPQPQVLNFWENMICGAVSRSVAQMVTHPANTMKTLLQSSRDTSANRLTIKEMAKVENFKMLSRGAGAQLILSIPHGAVNFAVLEYVRRRMSIMAMNSDWAKKQKENNNALFGPAMDFVSSAVATVCCSVVSTPQMMIVDNIMAGTYPNLVKAVQGLSAERGVSGFYSGWWPGLAGKIPSYALTWTLFQQLKQLQVKVYQRPAKDFENSIMGCMASATSVCIMIPMDTIKTRLVTQRNYPNLVPYKGIADAAIRISREEGLGTFYRGLPPRLISVVPMVGIQFGTYEFMRKVMLSRRTMEVSKVKKMKTSMQRKKELEEAMGEKSKEMCHQIESISMEVAADDDQPFPAPKLMDYVEEKKKKRIRK